MQCMHLHSHSITHTPILLPQATLSKEFLRNWFLFSFYPLYYLFIEYSHSQLQAIGALWSVNSSQQKSAQEVSSQQQLAVSSPAQWQSVAVNCSQGSQLLELVRCDGKVIKCTSVVSNCMECTKLLCNVVSNIHLGRFLIIFLEFLLSYGTSGLSHKQSFQLTSICSWIRANLEDPP